MSSTLTKALDELRALREQAATCTRCELYKCGTQTVFGEGSPGADVMFVGEQPGDKEDLEGRPFVGPAAASSTRRSRRWASTATARTSPTR